MRVCIRVPVSQLYSVRPLLSCAVTNDCESGVKTTPRPLRGGGACIDESIDKNMNKWWSKLCEGQHESNGEWGASVGVPAPVHTGSSE